jgi:hypothetical protein
VATIDERRLDELIVESQDLQADAVRAAAATCPELAEVRARRRGGEVDLGQVARYDANRRRILAQLGVGAAGLATRGVLAGGFGRLLAGVLTTPARADEAVDVQVLQTATSLEVLAVATYGVALGLPFIKSGNPLVIRFAQTTMRQHDEHRLAFQAQTRMLGGRPQTQPNPRYAPAVERARPDLRSALDVVKLAAALEEVLADTYLADLALFQDSDSKRVMASVMGVESQHLATLRAVRALLESGAPQLVKVPIGADVARLPAAVGSVAFADAMSDPDRASPPAEGASR